MDKEQLARNEIAEISENIQRLQRRKDELQSYLKTADSLKPKPSSMDDIAADVRERLAAYSGAKRIPRNSISQRASRIAAVRKILLTKQPLTTRALIVELKQKGIEVPGMEAKDQVLNLSSDLSKSEGFVSDRANGWSLEVKTPEGVSAPSGVGENR